MKRPVVLVTGGARGIGAAICRRMALDGYNVVVNFHRSLEAVQDLIHELSPTTEVFSFQADVSKPGDVNALIGFCMDRFGRLDVLVNNASYSSSGGWNVLPAEIDWQEWQKTIDVDVRGTMLCSHAAAAIMKPQGSGKIINFSSAAALWGDVPTYFYTAAKSALVGLTRTMARAFAPEVQVNCVAPGSIGTDWIRTWNLTDKEIQEIANETPSKRIGTPEEVAGLVAFLASPQCRFITGQIIAIDGGVLMT